MGIENEDCYQLKRFDVDRIPNSHDYPNEKTMVLVKRINVSIVEIKGEKPNFLEKWRSCE